jgi:hypothetical protein
MSVLLFLITLIVGLVVTAVINRLMALFYCFILVVFGIWLLLTYYKDALPPIIEFIMFMIVYLFGTFFWFGIFLYFCCCNFFIY